MRETVRESARSTAGWCADAGRRAGKRGKRGVVYFITSDKNIQALRTAAAFAILDKSFTAVFSGVSLALLNGPGVSVSTNFLVAAAMCGVWWFSTWADNNTEEWRDTVEKATGEEAADDDASEESSGDG